MKKISVLIYPIVLVVALLSFAGCDTVALPTTPTASNGQATSTPGSITQATPEPASLESLLAQYPEAIAINIRDSWNGLSPFAPLDAAYILTRAENGDFTGTVRFAVGPEPLTAVEDITIPAADAQAFLRKLAATPLKKGQYQPKIEHTDDYPLRSITIQIGTRTISYYTQSQGEHNVPWGADILSTTYIVDSTIPSEALNALSPYMKEDSMQRLIDQAKQQPALPHLFGIHHLPQPTGPGWLLQFGW